MLAWFFSAVLNLPKPQDSLGSVDGNFVVGLKWDHAQEAVCPVKENIPGNRAEIKRLRVKGE